MGITAETRDALIFESGIRNEKVNYKRLAGGARSERMEFSAIVTFSVRSIAISELNPSNLHKAKPSKDVNATNIAI